MRGEAEQRCLDIVKKDKRQMPFCHGELLSRENPAYRLSRDIDLLTYIYDKRYEIEFVIFVDKNGFHGTWIDVIKSANALEIIKLLPEGYDFHCAMVGSSHFGMGVSIPKTE